MTRARNESSNNPGVDKLALRLGSAVVTSMHQQFQLDNVPAIIQDECDQTVDSLVMARRMLPSHNSSRNTICHIEQSTHYQEVTEFDGPEQLEQTFWQSTNSVGSVFLSSANVFTPKQETFLSPPLTKNNKEKPVKSPNGVIEGPYGQDYLPHGNDSLDLEDVIESPVKSHGRTRTSTARAGLRRRSRVSLKEPKKDETLVTLSPRRNSKLTRTPSTRKRASAMSRVQASPSPAGALRSRASGMQALQAGEQCIAFPNFQDSFISGSSTDNTPCPAFSDSVFTLSQEENMFFLRDDTDSECEHALEFQDEQQPSSPRRSSPLRRRSSRLMRVASTKRSEELQRSSRQLLLSELLVTESPRRATSRRQPQRSASPTRRSSTILQQRKVQQQLQSTAPVTRYELERRHALVADLFAEMKTSAADRRRRRHSSIEQQILKQKCNPRGREADIVCQAFNDMDSFNDSFTDLIQSRRTKS